MVNDVPALVRAQKIRDRLKEFTKELEKSEELGDQFQSGYYVHHKEVEWLVELNEKLFADLNRVAFFVCGQDNETAEAVYKWLMREGYEAKVGSTTVWVLAPYGHRLSIWGVFATEEEAIAYARDLGGGDEDEDWQLDEDEIHLEEFVVEGLTIG
jgi:hypothetical protein